MTAPVPDALEAALRAADRYEASHPLCSFEKKLAYARSTYDQHLAAHDPDKEPVLPIDVDCGGVVFRKGVALRQLIDAATRWKAMASAAMPPINPQAVAELREALAAHDALAAAQWQPGETAPRDGTPILGAYDLNDGSFDLVVVWWTGTHPYPWSMRDNACVEWRIAYWQPLPTPPAAAPDDAAKAQP